MYAVLLHPKLGDKSESSMHCKALYINCTKYSWQGLCGFMIGNEGGIEYWNRVMEGGWDEDAEVNGCGWKCVAGSSVSIILVKQNQLLSLFSCVNILTIQQYL